MGGIWFGVCWHSVSVWLWRCGFFMQSEALRASDCIKTVAVVVVVVVVVVV